MNQHNRVYQLGVLPMSTKAWAVNGAGLQVIPVTIRRFNINTCFARRTASVVYEYDLEELAEQGHGYPDPWHELYLSKDDAEKRRMEKYTMLRHHVDQIMRRSGK